ncbi:MAG TPA: Flp pilus assembly protein CpaB [Bauldia sp.]|nr:Flp pilus assembly protein CpaB [Bauldia sp.]
MRFSRVVVLAVALVAGLVAAFLALNLTSTPNEPPVAAVEAPTGVQILVATNDIPMGKTVENGMVEWRDWPSTALAPTYITRASDPDALNKVNGSIARAAIYSGEPINASKLIHSDRGFMSAILPPGKRAVATKIAADTSAGGFILPNDRVDVIMTRQTASTENGGPPQYVTETILNNVRVLAIDQTIEEKNGEKVVVGQTATLELSPQQAQILSVAQQITDRLTLALRSIADGDAKPSDAASDAVHLIGGTKKNGSVTVVRNGVAREVTGLR